MPTNINKGGCNTMKTTLSYIRNLVKSGAAHDITSLDFYAIEFLRKTLNLEKIAYSIGIYGINGALFKDNNGELYAITSRSTALFQLV